jgi:hypothetical protein
MNGSIRPPRTSLDRLETQVAAAERLIAEFESKLSGLRSSEERRPAEARLRRMRFTLDILLDRRERARAA